MREHLLLIDMQNDFCHQEGKLFVPEAEKNLNCLSAFVKQKMKSWHQIFLTMDSHWYYDIAHASFWLLDGRPPKPFTSIDISMLESGICRVNNPADYHRAHDYLVAMHRMNQLHTIWPDHCVVGSWGHQLVTEVNHLLKRFQDHHKKSPTLIFKGLNPYSEHFSAFSALVPDPMDLSTIFNQDFADKLLDCDRLYVAGQALSHCVGESLSDLYEHSKNKELFRKITLLIDCTAPVSGFEAKAQAYLEQFKGWGMTIATTKEILE